ncbi:hypothetical protein BKA57DRAFT_473812 [Linnemannia elongata]|nr:hypothetical protein BKA57DRAFT_473812 [Linnemannia elongata]
MMGAQLLWRLSSGLLMIVFFVDQTIQFSILFPRCNSPYLSNVRHSLCFLFRVIKNLRLLFVLSFVHSFFSYK